MSSSSIEIIPDNFDYKLRIFDISFLMYQRVVYNKFNEMAKFVLFGLLAVLVAAQYAEGN